MRAALAMDTPVFLTRRAQLAEQGRAIAKRGGELELLRFRQLGRALQPVGGAG